MTASEPCYIFCVRARLVKTHDPDETKNYIWLEDCTTNERCIDCIISCLPHINLSFEAMERRFFSVWFSAIYKHRIDIVEKLIEYGAERYSEYKHHLKYCSYTVLLTSFLYYKDNWSNTMLLENFLNLFLSAGIDPTVEATDICTKLNHMKELGKNYFFNAVFRLLGDYGFKKEIIESGKIIAVFEPEISPPKEGEIDF